MDFQLRAGHMVVNVSDVFSEQVTTPPPASWLNRERWADFANYFSGNDESNSTSQVM